MDRLADLLWRHAGAVALILVVLGLTAGLCASEPTLTAERTPALPAGRWVMAEVTAYCPCARCTDGDLITANGARTTAVPYNLAADRSLAFGVRLYVPPGLGVLDHVRADDRFFAVDDRGGALDTEARERRTLRLDLRVRDHWWAVRFGRRLLPVYLCD
ncbi:MAG: hypothetical protein RL030_2779 [Pseudomonadota bacterium]|jgi:hypothetical protein